MKRPITGAHMAEAIAAINKRTEGLRLCEIWMTANAGAAFQLGLTHGRMLSKPQPARDVMYVFLNAPRNYDWRKIHTRKMRQVYGAGYDVGAATKKEEMRNGEA